jgi:LPXTG-site transpeptidase (sortase) family protein
MGEINRDKNIHITLRIQNAFALYVFSSFLLLTLLLFAIDFVPELQIGQDAEVFSSMVDEAYADSSLGIVVREEAQEQNLVSNPALPVRIKIDTIGLDTAILNPSSNDIEVLDRALLSGAVHYPGSGLLGENANVLLFGHSSYLPVVHNKAFKAFNELNKLRNGDLITVFSENIVYTYKVDDVTLSDAEDTLVTFDSPKPILTLATCNTFGAKQERWIVTASLVSKNKF